jgi:hypothetical protein
MYACIHGLSDPVSLHNSISPILVYDFTSTLALEIRYWVLFFRYSMLVATMPHPVLPETENHIAHAALYRRLIRVSRRYFTSIHYNKVNLPCCV